VRQPNWDFQGQRLTRKSGDWESINIGSKFNGQIDPVYPAIPPRLLTKQHLLKTEHRRHS